VGYCIVRCLIVLYTCLTVSCVHVLGSVIRFMIVLFFVPFAFYFVCSVFRIVLYTFSLYTFVPFYLCMVYGPLPPAEIPIAVNKSYHIIKLL
jgi:hypothetical protein